MFSFIQANIQGLRANKVEIRELLIKRKIDVACLQETWLDDESIGKINIPLYELISDNREDGYGGAAIIIRTELNTEKLKVVPPNPYIQIVAARIKQAGLVIASVYVKPNTPIATFRSLLTLSITSLAKYNKLIIMGDFNSHHSECTMGSLEQISG